MDNERTTKRVKLAITATFHGGYISADEVVHHLEQWISAGLEDRDDLRGWSFGVPKVFEIPGDPHGYDNDAIPDWVCVAGNGDEYAEHDYNETECRRCGAEPED